MVFYLIGLGLGDVEDISVKGLNIIRRCTRVYLECYTSLLSSGLDWSQLEQFYGRPLVEADREMVEQNIEPILKQALGEDIALLVVGDPFGATTHADLVIRAKKLGVPVEVIHNASILTAVGCCGLQLYNFGATVSIPMWSEGWTPESFVDKIANNRLMGMHTLCLLDIKVKEQSVENLMKSKKVYEPPTFLTCAKAAEQILTVLNKRSDIRKYAEMNGGDTPVIGLARVGWKDQKIVYCSLARMASKDIMGQPLHSLIIPAPSLHPIEEEMLQTFLLCER